VTTWNRVLSVLILIAGAMVVAFGILVPGGRAGNFWAMFGAVVATFSLSPLVVFSVEKTRAIPAPIRHREIALGVLALVSLGVGLIGLLVGAVAISMIAFSSTVLVCAALVIRDLLTHSATAEPTGVR